MTDLPEVPQLAFLHPDGNGLRILSLDGGDARCYSQLSIMAELMHRLKYEHGRPVRPCEFFHSITGVGASGIIAILLGVLGMTVERASEAFIGICGRVFAADVCNETCRSEILRTEIERVLEGLSLRSDSLLAGNLAHNAGCLVTICHSAAAIADKCRLFRNYPSRYHSHNPTIVEAAQSSWATPGLFSSILIGPPHVKEELTSAVNGFNNPTLQAVKEVRDFYGADRAVSTFLSLGSGKRGPVSVHSNDSLQRTAQQTDVMEEDIERELGLSGVYYRFSPEYTIESDTFDIGSNHFGSIEAYTRAYIDGVKTGRAMERYLEASVHTSMIDLNFSGGAAKFDSLEGLCTTTIHTLKAILPRLMAILNDLQQGGYDQKESIESVIDDTIDKLKAVNTSESQISHAEEAQILDHLNDELNSFMACTSEQMEAVLEAKKEDENVARLLDETAPPVATIDFSVRELGKNEKCTTIPRYPASCTLADLMDRLARRADPSCPKFPEFWRENKDPRINCVTASAVYWEYLQPNLSVRQAINDWGLEMVFLEGDYVVVVLMKDGIESGKSIPLIQCPYYPNGSAKGYLEHFFAGHKLENVLWLKDKADASEEKFARLKHFFKTTALYVEVLTDVQCGQKGLLAIEEVKEGERSVRNHECVSETMKTTSSSSSK